MQSLATSTNPDAGSQEQSIAPAQEPTNVQERPTIGIAFNLPEATPYISCLRKTMCQLLKAACVSQQEVDDLETVIGELATNAARHAQGGNYHVLFELHGNQVTITVTDNGKGFDPSTLLEAGTLRDDNFSVDEAPRVGGFGLPLVQFLTDHLSIERNEPTGMIVRARKTVCSASK
ncbi:MAG: ATP-binding protein [Proteobacteria bacterium]|nr:MAG: ATP-binding protein [Pseudomonadota bacterium]